MDSSTPPFHCMIDQLYSAASMVGSKRNSVFLMGGSVVDRIRFMDGRNHACVPGGFKY